MDGFLDFCANNYILFLLLALLFGFGIAGYYVDYNTNVLAIDKKKKALVKKNMNISELKKQIKDKNKSLSGVTGEALNDINDQGENDLQQSTLQNTEKVEEDLSVPFNLDIH